MKDYLSFQMILRCNSQHYNTPQLDDPQIVDIATDLYYSKHQRDFYRR